jgi:hypothetical protein
MVTLEDRGFSLHGVVIVPLEAGAHRRQGVGTWCDGPLPLKYGDSTTDASLRRTLVDGRAASVLYGRRDGHARRHLFTDEAVVSGDVTFGLHAVEWLASAELGGQVDGLAVLHVRATCRDARSLLRAWERVSRPQRDGGLALLADATRRASGIDVGERQHGYHPFRIAFVQEPLPGQGIFEGSDLDARVQWGFAFAAGVSPESFAPGVRDTPEIQQSVFDLSADWTAIVLRDGAAFLTTPGRPPSSFLTDLAGTLVATVYTDAFLLGLLQSISLSAFTDELAQIRDPARSIVEVEGLDARLSRLRNALWWQQVTQSGHANRLIELFHAQRRLPRIMEQTTAELESYVRQTTLRTNRTLTIAVSVFALFGLVSAAVDVYLLYDRPWTRPPGWATGLASVVLLAGFLFILTLGGLTPRWVRRRTDRHAR